MYAGSATGSVSVQEEYLLGKRKAEDLFQKPKDFTEIGPEKIVDSVGFSEKNLSDRDLEAKMREDPMFAVMKREQEFAKSILDNPLKSKALKAGRVILVLASCL
jgi:hypothetical protein